MRTRQGTYRIVHAGGRAGGSGYGVGHRVGLLLENRPAFFLHWLALNALGAIGPEKGVVPALIKALGDGNWEIRERACGGLARIGGWGELDLSYKIKARIDAATCIHCNLCYRACEDGAHQAIVLQRTNGHSTLSIDDDECVGCRLCHDRQRLLLRQRERPGLWCHGRRSCPARPRYRARRACVISLNPRWV